MRRWAIVETDRFTQALTSIGPPGHDWTDTRLGIWWYLEREPAQVGFATQDLDVRILMFDTPDGLPDLKIFYEIGPDTVTLLSAKAADPDPF